MSEARLKELADGAGNPLMAEACKIITSCGERATGPVRLIRKSTSRGQVIGLIDGLETCENPVCPYCGPAILAARYEALRRRMSHLERSGELDECITYAGAFTCQHRHGDDIAGIINLLRGAEASFRATSMAQELIAGWVCGTEITTGGLRGNGAHPHNQFLYTLNGTDRRAHEELWEEAERHFQDYFRKFSKGIMGTARMVAWKQGWVSEEGPGLTGFYGKNAFADWDLLREVTHGNMKNHGIWKALSQSEFAEFLIAMKGGRLLSVGGCWVPEEVACGVLNGDVIATMEPSRWNPLAPDTKRMIRTIAMSPIHWGPSEAKSYADLVNQDQPIIEVDALISLTFRADLDRLAGSAAASSHPLPIAVGQ